MQLGVQWECNWMRKSVQLRNASMKMLRGKRRENQIIGRFIARHNAPNITVNAKE